MFRRLTCILSLLLLVSLSAQSQYDPHYSHYWAMETAFNPAAAGKESKLNAVGSYSIDFAGFEHNPRTAYLGADMPLYFLKSYHGVGLSLISDKIGLFTHQRLSIQYANKQKLFGGQLSIGIQVGILNEKFDGSKLDIEDPDDPVFTKSEVSGNSVDFAAGLYYTHGRWYAGVSALHLSAPVVSLGEKNELEVERSYYLTGGYNIKLRNPFLTIPTSVLASYDGTSFRADITARLVYKNDTKMLYGGVTYSPTNSVTAVVGGSFHGINIGYSYELYTSAINPGNGSHGLFVSYQTDINLHKKGRNKHKSVRYL